MLATVLTLCVMTARAGTWTALNNPPPSGLQYGLLLSDGTVLCADGGTGWYRLTPNNKGSYVNGAWSELPSMTYSRLFYSSAVLTNGNVYVAGGEYGGGPAELFNTLASTWSVIPPASQNFSDAASKVLPNGNVLQSDSQSSYFIYNVASNLMTSGGSCEDMNETCWVRLPNNNILAVTDYSTNSEHYVPANNAWYSDNFVPVPVFGNGGELGPAFVLPNGTVFQVGASDNTAIYTPGAGSLTNAGSWVAGPQMIFGGNSYGAVDAPGAEMITGNVLLCLGPTNGFGSACTFFEYDYVTNDFTAEDAPGGGTNYTDSAPFGTSMLCLPDGTVLFFGGQGSTSLFVYAPSGTPLAAGTPTISSVTENADGSYHLTGVGLNGITGGAAYGDDWQMDTSYPLVRLTNSTSGSVYYARTYNWSSTTIQNPNPVTTEFTLPSGLPAGTYSLVVTVMGNVSTPISFTYAPPSVPTGLTAASGSNAFVKLSWNSVSGATAYNLKRAPTSGGYFSTIATQSGTTFTNTGLTNGLTYYYKVAAVGSGGPSSDSAIVSATPSGPTLIPGATAVSLTSYYNRTGISGDGRTFSSGLDGGAWAYSSNLLGPSVFWNNLLFKFGPANASDCVYCNGQTITLTAGIFNSLQFLATGVNGNQANQTFTVTYTDNSTSTFTQSFSDWANPQSYAGEFNVARMPYRDSNSGGNQLLYVTVDAYVFALNQTKTVKSVTVPTNSNLVLLSMMLAIDPVNPPLTSYYNRAGIYTDGTSFTNPPTGGMDENSPTPHAYSGTVLGNAQTWSNNVFGFGTLNATNVISSTNQTIALPAGNYSRLLMLATAVNGNQASQSFVVTYSDATTSTFAQKLSDWFTPQNNPGETKAVPTSHRVNSDGGTDNAIFNLYGYSFSLNPAKTTQSLRLPNDANVIVLALSLVPEWPPTFAVNPFTLPKVNAGQAYSGTIATNASDLNGDAITFAKVSGPAWLNVAANGTLSGTPANTNANTNTFVVSATDTGGLSNVATLYIYVNGAPSFVANPFAEPSIVAGMNYSGTIATNATDPNPGDALTFGLVTGPTWLTVASNGALSGIPYSVDDGSNVFTVSVTDPGGLSNTATMSIQVTPAPPIVSSLSSLGGGFQLNWAGGIGPYQVQATPTLQNPSWQNIGTVSGTNLSILPTNSSMFYRILGM